MPGVVTVEIPYNPDPIYLKAYNILKRKINERCDAQVVISRVGDCIICLDILSGIGKEGFKIEDYATGGVKIIGNDRLGLMYGIGKFLRSSGFGDTFKLGDFRGTSVPWKEVRGVYFATHFNNYYHNAPINEIKKYMEDLMLWGINAVTVWFDMHHYSCIDDPESRVMIKRLREILGYAREIGLETGMLILSNEAYMDSPEELRADWKAGHNGYTVELNGHYHMELCPNKPGSMKLLLRWREEIFAVFSDISLDYIWIWPYDQGGCTCSECSPWGANGFLTVAMPIADLIKKYFPSTKVVLSTWYFDYFIADEWKEFLLRFSNIPRWVDYLMIEYPGDIFQSLMEGNSPDGLPVLGFPEISMYGAEPWGGFGANPMPVRLQESWKNGSKILSGGFSYSEGIYEDINKVLIAQFYFNEEATAEQVVKEYIGFEYAPEYTEELYAAIQLMEKTYKRRHTPDPLASSTTSKNSLYEKDEFIIEDQKGVSEVFRIIEGINERLPEKQRCGWRWRILYLRGLIDYELVQNGNSISTRCENALNSLVNIYNAQNSSYIVKPPVIESLRRMRKEGIW